MRRLFIVIAALFGLCFVCSAETLSADEARAFAEKFFHIDSGKSVKSSGAELELVPYGSVGVKSSGSGSPSFYIFNRSTGGFVVISAESEFHPLLAYSYSDLFHPEDIPDGMRWIMEIWEGNIDEVRASGKKASQEVLAEWENIGSTTKAGANVKTLDTVEFGQESPYNDKCPVVPGETERALSGCVATASAILMQYQATHRSNVPDTPEQVTLPDYSYTNPYNGQSTTIQGHSLIGHKYRFSEMPYYDYQVQKASAEVKESIAELMHDLGVAYRMQYSENGSGTYANMAVQVLGTYFRYRKDNRTELRDAYSEEEWFAKIKDSIDNGNPVFYSGDDPSQGGHCFIIDGYDADNGLVRPNYGWTGSYHYYSTFYRLAFRFEYHQQAVFNLVPNTDGGEYDYPDARLFYTEYGEFYGLKTGSVIEAGKSFYLDAGYIQGLGPQGRNFYLRTMYVGTDGSRTPVGPVFDYNSTLELGYMTRVSDIGPITLTAGQVKLGAKLEMEYSSDYPASASSVTEWVPLTSPRDGSVVESLPVVSMFYIDVPFKMSLGTSYELKLINGDIPWAYNTTWDFDRTEGVTRAWDAKLSHGSTDNRTFITFSEAGTYFLTAEVTHSDRTEKIVTIVEVK